MGTRRTIFQKEINAVICRTAMPKSIADSAWYYSHYLWLSYDEGKQRLIFQPYDFLYQEPVFLDKYVECAFPVSEETLWEFFQNWLSRGFWVIVNIDDFCVSGHWIQGRLLVGNYDKEGKRVEVTFVDEVGIKTEWKPFSQICGWWFSSSKVIIEKKLTVNLWKINKLFCVDTAEIKIKQEARSACREFRKMQSAVLTQTQEKQRDSYNCLLEWLELCRQRNRVILFNNKKLNQRISHYIADAEATGEGQLKKLLDIYQSINRLYAYRRISDEKNSP